MAIIQPTLAFTALLFSLTVFAQEPVVGVDDPESLFNDSDPNLHANKQVVLHIMRELLQCNHWDEADRWLTERYLQHNPNVVSGRDHVVAYFKATRKKTATCDELVTPIVAVLATGDLVTVVWPMTCTMPNDPPDTYSSTWFDMWRILDGRADEHWDAGMKIPTGCKPGE